jgi:dihydromethanopterin reductase
MDIKLIAAVGKSGQLGLDGGLPWTTMFPEDRIEFRKRTTGGIVIVGARTWPTVMHLQDTHDRAFLHDDIKVTPEAFLELYRIEPDHTVWIAGGAKTYLRWLHLVTERVITVLDFDGPADTFMPPEIWSPQALAA